jgi:hypothetical protein
LSGQNVIKDQIVVKTESVKDYFYDLASLNGLYGDIEIETISKDLNLYLLKFSTPVDDFGFNFIKKMNSTKFIAYNYTLEERRTPNDPSYGNQWYLDFINMPKVWDYTTGGKTKEGKEIVIAILDTGVQTNHSDLEGNIFINSLEIPGNGIDDDNNGYRDDVSGINVKSNNGTHAVTFHGTWVAGVAGAKGNNSLGVTGVNWDVKILPLTEVTNVAGLLKGYDYILNMRKAYNQSGGTKGALIVAANYSGGLKNRFGTEAEFRPWCEMYDLLGAQGILSVGSVANSSFDVDIEGDMPTTCESEFLISVTSINAQSNLAAGSAYGKKNVDIAAPGENILGLANNNTYKSDIGTSASAPMVAGVISLLYSADCSNLDKLIEENPRSLALSLKNAILNGVTKTSSLEDITATGGYLDAFKSYVNLQDLCENQILDPSIKGDLAIKFTSQLGNEILINYVTPDEQSIDFILSNSLGQTIRKGNIIPPQYGDKTFSLDVTDIPSSILHLSLFRNKEKVTTTLFVSTK